MSDEENKFNFVHSSTRMVIEKTFGVLKGRFRRLKFLDLQDVQHAVKVVVVACLLHNIFLFCSSILNMKRYVLVEFIGDDSVEIVPSRWLITNNSCYWPPYRKERLTTAVKKCEVACDSWLIFSVRVLYSCGKCSFYYVQLVLYIIQHTSTSYTEHHYRTFIVLNVS